MTSLMKIIVVAELETNKGIEIFKEDAVSLTNGIYKIYNIGLPMSCIELITVILLASWVHCK